jgi:segregation and condensation protein B
MEKEGLIDNEGNVNEKELMQKIEAALFLSASYLDVDHLVRVTNVNPLMVKEMMDKLIEKYDKNDSSIIITRREVEGKPVYKMDVKKEFHNLVNKMVTGEAEFSKSEQETLAIIAYKQPIKQSSIVRIRSNKAYDHIKHFIAVGLVKSKRLGRTYELTLSEDFYNYFNINEKKNE